MGPSQPTPVYGGRFRVEREAGRGGMATIYQARDLMGGEVVALKVLDTARGCS